jgi:hypothetical protein
MFIPEFTVYFYPQFLTYIEVQLSTHSTMSLDIIIIIIIIIITAISRLPSVIRSSKSDVLRGNSNRESISHYFKWEKL